jgi:phage N-6-adenine-methyltransferase
MEMPINNGMLSSNRDDWETPPWLFEELDQEFRFNLDVCATHKNALCPAYYTKETDGLRQTWYGSCFMNPPYGREILNWMQKAANSRFIADVIVCLIPARTDTKWWHRYVMAFANEIRFIDGRITFYENGKPAKHAAPFPSAIVVYRAPMTEILVVKSVSYRGRK